MALMAWSPALSVKVRQFDDQHVKLVDMINELYDAMKGGKGHDVLGKVLNALVSYTVTHFAEEERMMALHGYPETTEHKAAHGTLVKQVMELQQKFKEGQTVLTMSVMVFLKEWLLNHIQVVDKRYGSYLNSRGVV